MKMPRVLLELRVWKILVLIGASAAGLVVQIMFWPDAGKSVGDRSYAYSFQQNMWSEQIHRKFHELTKSDSAAKVWLSTGEKKLSEPYLVNLELYQFHLGEILRSLKHLGNTGSYILSDLERIHQKVWPELGEDRRSEIVQRYEAFHSMTEELFSRIKILQDVSIQLRNTLAPVNAEPPSEEARVASALEQIQLLSRLYLDESFFMKPGDDHFAFVRNYASASEQMLPLYGELVEKYNHIVDWELALKNCLTILFALLGAYIAFIKEYRGLGSEPTAENGKDGGGS